jgi:hypothetical protein
MKDPLDDFFAEMEIMEEEQTPHLRKSRKPVRLLDLLSLILVAGTIGLGLLFGIIFINPQSRLNPLPPTVMPGQFLTHTSSSTPELVLPPTWTPIISPTDTPTLTPEPTDKPISIVKDSPTPAADLEGGDTFSKQVGSPTPEVDPLPTNGGGNLPEELGQVYVMDDVPANAQLAPRLNQPQLASVLNASISTEPSLTEALPLEDGISDLFTPEIQYWEDEILAWAEEYELDPNLIATVMQIESCGYTRAKSAAGAMGLFQVMPHHFKKKEDPYDPDTNAFRGLSWLQKTLKSGGSTTMALAGYNAGLARAKNPHLEWPHETRRYVFWGLNIYQDTMGGYDNSFALDNWLSKGGSVLCHRAAKEQQDK